MATVTLYRFRAQPRPYLSSPEGYHDDTATWFVGRDPEHGKTPGHAAWYAFNGRDDTIDIGPNAQAIIRTWVSRYPDLTVRVDSSAEWADNYAEAPESEELQLVRTQRSPRHRRAQRVATSRGIFSQDIPRGGLRFEPLW